ncbi:interferon-activable protein 203-like isoform X3 [Octodon degus]|uniref:Interferon-activable protein 203-like isoform X3 n=1 Tax=Octodon degus TaxID=10160 RepID=A0A6P6D6W6_OCTDE|nr:interferon-activable protein 203-like isoform X3 [Octodon degus]
MLSVEDLQSDSEKNVPLSNENSTENTDDLERTTPEQEMDLLTEDFDTNLDLQSPLQNFPTSFRISSTKKPKMKHVPYEPSEENGYQTECKEIVVLKVTEPFIYDVKEPQKVIIHATVATEEEFFRVKIFDMAFKDMFIPKNVLSISHYVGQDGFLEISNISTVSFIRAEQGWNISSTLVQRANATPKIEHILSLSEGKHVNGSFTVLKKTVRGECIFYEIQDNTGKMEVMVCGRLASIYCEEGDKLYLTGFAVSSSEGGCQLRSVLHSHLRVIKPQKSNDETTQP